MLTNMGGTTLGWSVTLLGFAIAWLCGCVVARIMRFLPRASVQIAGMATLLAAASAWSFLFGATPAQAAVWSQTPVLAGILYFGLLMGLPVVALSATAILAPNWLRRPDSPGQADSLSFLWLGGLGGLILFAAVLEPNLGLSKFAEYWRIAVPIAGGVALAIGLLVPLAAIPAIAGADESRRPSRDLAPAAVLDAVRIRAARAARRPNALCHVGYRSLHVLLDRAARRHARRGGPGPF